jgi:DNA-binding MarR family transcriptional regulator
VSNPHNVDNSDSGVDVGGALERLFEVGVRLADGMDQGLVEFGLTRARAEVIWRLGRHGPMTQRALSRLLHITPRSVTGLIDALEADGFVARGAHPTDRRATLVSLTDRGGAAARRMGAGYRELAQRLFGDLPTAELTQLISALDRMLERLRADEAMPASAGPEPSRGKVS